MAKEEARDWYTGCSALGAVGVITPEPLSTAAGTGALIGQGVGLIGMGLWNAFSSVRTSRISIVEEDESATAMLASVAPIVFPEENNETELDQAVSNVRRSGAAMINASRLVLCSLCKLGRALDKDNAVHSLRQRRAAEVNLRVLEANKALFEASMRDLGRAARATPFTELSVSRNEVLELRDTIVRKGRFPKNERFVFEQMAATENEQVWAIDEVGQASGKFLPDNISGNSLFDEAAASLAVVNIRKQLFPEWAVLSERCC